MWRLFRRRPRLPADRRPELAADERIVAWAALAGDDVVVATNRGLILPGRGLPGRGRLEWDRPGSDRLEWDRIGWHEINKATWSGRALSVVPAEVVAREPGYDVVIDMPTVTFTLLDPGEVPHQVRTRVTRSVAYTAHHRVPGGGLRVAARRVSGVDGLSWTVRYDAGTDPAAPEVRERTGELVAAAQADARGSA